MNRPGTVQSGHPQHIRVLDGLRAIAILLVICDHYLPRVVTASGPLSRILLEACDWAGSGVDLFFVLSGFLITGILLDARGSPNYFRRFYWRRSLRIFPAFYALLLFVLIFLPAVFGKTGFPWFAFYLRNWVGADRLSDPTLGHLWSLAVEEQFYIGWSIVVFLCPRRYLMRTILILIAMAPLVRAAMHGFGYPGYLIFRVTPARMDSLLSGALLATAIRYGWMAHGKRIASVGIQVGLAGLLLLRLLTGVLSIDVAAYQIAEPSLIALLFTSWMLLCLNLHEKSLAHAFLTCGPFRIVARYSYAIYLWHLVAAFVVALILNSVTRRYPLSREWFGIVFILSASGLSFAIAAVSWELIERPALSLKDRLFPAVERIVPPREAVISGRI